MSSFGGTVKLTGESEYRRALSQISQSLKVVSAEQKAAAAAFAAGDKSTKDMANTATTLGRALETEKRALASLKTQLATMQAEYDKSGRAHQALVKEYEAEKAKLAQIKATLGESSAEYKKQEKVVGELADKVAKSQSAYDKQGEALNNMKIKTANAETQANKTAKALDELGKEAEESGNQAEKAGDGFTIFKGVVADLSARVIASAINGLKRLGSAMVGIGKQAYSLYAQNEQLIGGVETLFGADSAQKLIANAEKAYKTAGLSANEYMEQATSFSATLLQGLSGDTEAAVKYADMAIQDMSDNANKMGTDMYMIQNAYQGFAKDNYTMLDNLKLGYGGTAGEMARLVNESGVLGKGVKVTAQTVKDVPFDQIIEAIHKTQQEIGITGTTAEEAAHTIEGSTRAVAAAWKNLLTGLGDEDADISALTDAWIEQVVVMGQNAIPRIKQIIEGMGDLVSAVWNEVIPKLAEEFPNLKPIVNALNWVKDNADVIISALAGIAAGFAAFKIASGITAAVGAIKALFGAIRGGMGIMAAFNAVMAINPFVLIAAAIAGLVAAFVVLWNKSDAFRQFWINAWNGVKEAVSLVWESLVILFTVTIPETFTGLIEVLAGWKDAAVQKFFDILKSAGDMVTGIITFFAELPVKAWEHLSAMLKKLAEWATQTVTKGKQAASDFIKNVMNFVSQLPSKMWTQLKAAYDKVSKWATDSVSKAKTAASNMVSGVVSYIKNLPSKMWSYLSSAVTKVKNFATNIVEKGKTAASDLVEAVIDGISDLPGDMYDWAMDCVQGFIDGFNEKVGWLIDLVSETAGKIADFLHFSRPDKGALRNYEEWMPHFIQGLRNSLRKASPALLSDVERIAGNISGAMALDPSGINIGRYDADRDMVSQFKQALSEMKIVLDDEVAARFIDKTVSRLVYA